MVSLHGGLQNGVTTWLPTFFSFFFFFLFFLYENFNVAICIATYGLADSKLTASENLPRTKK